MDLYPTWMLMGAGTGGGITYYIYSQGIDGSVEAPLAVEIEEDDLIIVVDESFEVIV